jgi:hypothetical protein
VKRGKRDSAGRPKFAGFVALFALAGLVAVLIAGVAVTVAGRKAGEREAIVDLRAQALRVARVRVQPALTEALLEGNITAVNKMGSAVRNSVLNDSVARVKIWNPLGTIVYSDEARLIGANRALTGDKLEAIRSKRVLSKISDPSEPENRFERGEGKLLEVDLRIMTPKGAPLLLQLYYRDRAVSDAGDHVWNRFRPYVYGALLGLTLVLVVVGSLLARRLRRSPARASGRAGDEAVQPEVLPNPGTDFVNAIEDLVARANDRGIVATLDTSDLVDPFPPAIAVLLFRATEEALRSLPAHEQAKPVTVRVSGHDHVATLDVVDHGDVERGTNAKQGSNGHAGVRALTDLVADAGGRLLVEAADNGGTRVHVEVPLQ